MKKGLTEIVFILDNSGSMQSIKDDAIGGYNSFIEDQRKAEGETTITLILFDTQVTKVYEGAKIHDVPVLTPHDYIPQGMTAMNDAIGTAIDSVGARLGATNEAERPENVIFAIMTDGHENASREYSGEQVKDKVTHQQEKYNWQFIFLGANIDSKKTASGLGIRADFAGDFVAKGAGASTAMLHAKEMVMSYRSTGTMESYESVSQDFAKSTVDGAKEISKSLKSVGERVGERVGVNKDEDKAKEDLNKEIEKMNEKLKASQEDTTPLVSDETAHDVVNDDVVDIDVLAELEKEEVKEEKKDK